jgi:autophagy-related protein 2
MDVSLIDTHPDGQPLQLLSLTIPRNSVSLLSVLCIVKLIQEVFKMSSPKSLLKLRFSSLVVPETTIKESRIKLTLCGFTYDMRPDFSWVADLETFFKSPPGVGKCYLHLVQIADYLRRHSSL